MKMEFFGVVVVVVDGDAGGDGGGGNHLKRWFCDMKEEPVLFLSHSSAF